MWVKIKTCTASKIKILFLGFLIHRLEDCGSFTVYGSKYDE